MKLQKTGHSIDLAFEGKYEPLEIDFLKSLDLRNKIALDIGSCIGYYALQLSRCVGTKGRVFAFEPESKNYKILYDNLILNQATNASCFQLALGNKNGTAELKIHESPGQHSVAKDGDDQSARETINMVRLDDFLKKSGISAKDIAYIKIDVEGYELESLKGMARTIKEARDDLVIQIEFAPQHLMDYTHNLEELFYFIRKARLASYYWDMRSKKLLLIPKISWLGENDTLKMFIHGDICSRNIILDKKNFRFGH